MSDEIVMPYDSLVKLRVEQYLETEVTKRDRTLQDFQNYAHFFDTELKKRKMPAVLRYLPLALTGLDPCYTGPFNSSGAWGLTVVYAIKSGLIINGTIDQRRDLILATPVALDYLKILHTRYNDWWLAMIAFCNGPSGLENARQRMGSANAGVLEFYHRGNLAVREFIPAFIAIVCLSEQITPELSKRNQNVGIETTTLSLKYPVNRKQFLSISGMTEQEFCRLNTVFTGSTLTPYAQYHLLIPTILLDSLLPKLDSLYSLFRSDSTLMAEGGKSIALLAEKTESSGKSSEYTLYKVKQGDMLGKIARKYKVSVREIKVWNNLKSDIIQPGQKLKILKR